MGHLPPQSRARGLGRRFLPVTDLFFRPRYAFWVVARGSRRVMHVGVTRRPTDAWVAQRPRYLIRDHSRKYGAAFTRVAEGSGITVLRTPVLTPQANGICERSRGGVRCECLDHLLVLSEGHLRRVLRKYARYSD